MVSGSVKIKRRNTRKVLDRPKSSLCSVPCTISRGSPRMIDQTVPSKGFQELERTTVTTPLSTGVIPICAIEFHSRLKFFLLRNKRERKIRDSWWVMNQNSSLTYLAWLGGTESKTPVSIGSLSFKPKLICDSIRTLNTTA